MPKKKTSRQEIKKYAVNKKNMKVIKLIHKVYTMLKELFLAILTMKITDKSYVKRLTRSLTRNSLFNH